MLLLIVLFLMLTLFSIIGAFYSKMSSKGKAVDRLLSYDAVKNSTLIDEKSSPQLERKSWIKPVGMLFGKLNLAKGLVEKTKSQLLMADIPLTGEEFLAIKLLVASVLSFFGYSLSLEWIVAIVILLAFWILPNIVVKRRIKKRVNAFDDQLSDAITIVSNSLKAGYSFMQAVSAVAKDTYDPLAKEFKQLFKEISFGIETNEALNNMMKRMPSNDLELMIVSILIQRDIGGNLSEILDNISTTIRERQKLQSELRTLTAQGKLSGMIIILIPIFLGFILYLFNSAYIMLLFTTTPGLIMTISAVISQIIGIFIIKKIITIEM